MAPGNHEMPCPVRVTLHIASRTGDHGRAGDERDFFRITLPRLREEFGGCLAVHLDTHCPTDRTLPHLVLQEERVASGYYPSWEVLRLTVGRTMAMEEMVRLLVDEAHEELRAQGLATDCWQEGLLR